MNESKKKRRRRERSALVEILNGFLSLFVLALLALGGLFAYAAYSFYADGPVTAEITFQVERGNGLSTIAARLEESGIIANRWIFQAGTLAQKKERAIKAGEFRIASHSSMAEVLKELTEGTPVTYAVTVPEGFTSWQVVERLKADANLTGEIAIVPAEGTLLPDTYVYERGDDRAKILERMSAAREKVLAEIWAGRAQDLPVATPGELVTLASIIEKETGIASERPQVAAVFVNRLRKGMRLQTDPATIYGITNGQGPLGRLLTRADIEKETPYNTYVIAGLPKGPIANPGRESLTAAANPAGSKALYFVAAGANPAQGHLFAATYDEHRKNVTLYRKALKAAAAAEEEAEAEAARDALAAEQAVKAGEEVSPVPAAQ